MIDPDYWTETSESYTGLKDILSTAGLIIPGYNDPEEEDWENHEYDPGNFANECFECQQAWWADIHRGEWDGFGEDYDDLGLSEEADVEDVFDCVGCGGFNPYGDSDPYCEFCEEEVND